MKKQKNKQAKKASKLAKAENLKQKTITVKNAEGEPDTEAVVLVQNKIDYTPKVSVIIPVYNVEEYLRECLDSVVNQTLKEIEERYNINLRKTKPKNINKDVIDKVAKTHFKNVKPYAY